MTTYYKAFKPGRIGPYSMKKWPKRLGAWVTVEGPLVPCENGIHVCRGESELVRWLDAEIYEVEVRGESVDAGDKLCCREVRLVRRVTEWNDKAARLFAADCAERALLGERAAGREPDERSWAAVDAARRFVRGEISRDELDAAWDAAWGAAWGAAWATARAAARDAARDAARAAARDAAWAAAWATARATARGAEREWQAARLAAYLEGSVSK